MREARIYFQRLKEHFEPFIESSLQEDHPLREKILELSLALDKSKKAFQETGSFAFCSSCAGRGIRCCGEGLEWKLSPEEFFINLILFYLEGRPFTFPETSPEDCLFLGERGCVLKLTPLFCRNFFCKELSEFLGLENLILLQNSLEAEAILTFKICEYLKKTNPSLRSLI
jgi:hypothetical protein